MLKRALTVLLLSSTLTAAATAAGDNWRTGWSTAPDSDGPPLPAQTLRQVVRTSAGGTQVRIRLSNLFGKAPLAIGRFSTICWLPFFGTAGAIGALPITSEPHCGQVTKPRSRCDA